MSKKRSVLLTTLAVVVIFSVMSLVVYRTSFMTRTRDVYQPYNLNSPAFARFNQEYAIAQQSEGSWTADPRQVAMRLVGYPENAAIAPGNLQILPARRRHFTALILESGHAAAPVATREHRIDLVQKGKQWQVEWAGARWSCAPGRGHQDLSIEPCS